ncbi:hypothetical protein QQ045_011014 [Rhodiola kirilowii]
MNGARVRELDTRELSEFLEHAGLRDISFSGSLFTWSDKHQLGRRIWLAELVKQLPSCKAAGLDGFNAEFFRAAWSVCGMDIVESINNFFRGGIMPEANRLRPVLEYLVDQSQAAFVKGRNITYNISLVQELLCKYNQKHLSIRCMLKIDITKAYDMVDWKFLKNILEVFGFPVKFVNWIMSCVTTSKFSVLINGCLEGYFSSTRGLRQGDPISPYLFTLVMEVFSRILGMFRQSNEFGYHPKCARISMSHLMFADDVIIFSKAELGSLLKIKEALTLFHGWSGLDVNVNKSVIYYGGCEEEEKMFLAQAAGF